MKATRRMPRTIDMSMAVVDWKYPIDDVLEEIDRQLEVHGLQIEQFDTGDDQYAWRIVKR